MKKFWWLTTMLAVALAMGCSDDNTDTPAADSTATDTGADTTSGGDATAADAAAGPACLASPYTPTADELTYYGKGCSEKSDIEYITTLATDPAKGDAMRGLILDCLLKPPESCSGDGDTTTPDGVKKVEACVKGCILAKAEKGIGDTCANCFGINGTCGFVKCIGACASNPSSDGCKACLACNCDPVFAACQQVPAAP